MKKIAGIQSVCVYCGSNLGRKSFFQKAAIELGETLARHEVRLVFGGGQSGLMGVVSNACFKAGGQVIGVMTEFLKTYEGSSFHVDELYIVESMHQRKQMMFEKSDAFIIFPGGLGTLDEAFEVLTWKQVGLHAKPIIFLNLENYWAPLLKEMFESMIHEGFVRKEDRKLFTVVSSVSEILPALHKIPRFQKAFVSKWG